MRNLMVVVCLIAVFSASISGCGSDGSIVSSFWAAEVETHTAIKIQLARICGLISWDPSGSSIICQSGG